MSKKALGCILDNKKTKQTSQLSHLTIGSPCHKLMFKDKSVRREESTKPKMTHKCREIQTAIQVRFSKCRMNIQYRYNQQKDRDSTHSSRIQEFKGLIGVTYCNIAQMNRKLKREKERSKERPKEKRLRVNLSSRSLVRKTEGRQPSPVSREFLKTSKFTRDRNESPKSIGIPRRHELKVGASRENRHKKGGNVMTIQFPSKYTTLSPYSRHIPKGRQQLSSQQSMSRTYKSYSTLRLYTSKRRKPECSLIGVGCESRKNQKSVEKRKNRVYSYQKL